MRLPELYPLRISTSPRGGTPSPPARVLVVDAEARVRRLLAQLVAHFGRPIDVIGAASLGEASACMGMGAYALVLSDRLEVLRFARERRPSVGRALLCGIEEVPRWAGEIEAAAPDALLEKPFLVRELFELLDDFLDARADRIAARRAALRDLACAAGPASPSIRAPAPR